MLVQSLLIVYLFDNKDTKENSLLSSITKQTVLFGLFEMKGRLNKFLEILQSLETQSTSAEESHPEFLNTHKRSLQVLQIYRNVDKSHVSLLQKDHPNVLTTQHNIAYTCHVSDNMKKQLRCEKRRSSLLGKENLNVATQHNIAQTQSALRK